MKIWESILCINIFILEVTFKYSEDSLAVLTNPIPTAILK